MYLADGFFSADAKQMISPETMAGITVLVKTTASEESKGKLLQNLFPSTTMKLKPHWRNPKGVKTAIVQPSSGNSPGRNGAYQRGPLDRHPATTVKQSKQIQSSLPLGMCEPSTKLGYWKT